MPVPIHLEPEPVQSFEACCICRVSTPYWTSLPGRTLGEQVAMCRHCASRAEPRDVPSKDVWCRRERIAHHPTFGDLSSGLDREYPEAPIVVPEDA